MKNLDADFAYFAQTLKKANDMVNDFVNVTPASSIYGEKAKKVLNLWNQNASTFGDFYQNFENWSSLMINAANEYHKFENSVFSSHQTTGGTADGVANSREQIKRIPPTSNDKQSTKPEDIPLVETISDTTTESITDTPASLEPITISSGQRVTLNGRDVYFLARDFRGNNYYVENTSDKAQVFLDNGSGSLIPYEDRNSLEKVVTRKDFVKDKEYDSNYYWNITYKNGTTPYQEISTKKDISFTHNPKTFVDDSK